MRRSRRVWKNVGPRVDEPPVANDREARLDYDGPDGVQLRHEDEVVDQLNVNIKILYALKAQ